MMTYNIKEIMFDYVDTDSITYSKKVKPLKKRIEKVNTLTTLYGKPKNYDICSMYPSVGGINK